MSEPHVVKMPPLSATMTEGVLVSWEKEIGAEVQRGDVVATVETDKAIMDVEIFRDGFLSGPRAAVGSNVPVGDPIAYIVETAEQVKNEEAAASSAKKPEKAKKKKSSDGASRKARTPARTAAPAVARSGGAPAPRPVHTSASPYARQLAGSLGVDLNQLQGSGPQGVIQGMDVIAAGGVSAGAGLNLIDTTPYELAEQMPVVGDIRDMDAMERAIAQSMTSSLSMPTFRTMMHARPEVLIATAKKMGVSVTVAIAKACAIALEEHPALNNAYVPGQQIAERDFVDIGMAVAVKGGGLVVPVLRGCETKEVTELHKDWGDLIKKARSRKLSPDDYANPTFMVSNMGMMGVSYFDAIPTPGTSAILAISAADEKGMPLTVTTDHRIASGAEVAAFLNTLKQTIEAPHTWLGPAGPLIPEGDWDYDVVVVGGGPGGEDCARALVENGVKKVAIINDSTHPGGECLWRGCIPSKTWRHAADIIRDREHDAHMGIESQTPKLNWQAMEKSRRQILEERGEMALSTDTGMKIKYIQGYGSFEDEHTLRIDRSGNQSDPHRRSPVGDGKDSETIRFGCAVIATGAPPFVPPIPGAKEGINNGCVLTSDTIWNLEYQPKKLGVIGGGAIGVEMAQMFNDFGTEVVLVEAQERILAEVEKDVAKELTNVLNKQDNLTVHTAAKVTQIEGKQGDMKLHFEVEGKAQYFACDFVLLATGKRPELQSLRLDNAGIKTEKSIIPVDATCRTNQSHIFAAGDVNGGLMLAHTAGHQGRVIAHNIIGERAKYDQDKDCGVIFTRPQSGFVGLSLEQAKAKGIDAMEMKTPIRIDAKAMITGHTDGLLKMVADTQTHKIIGFHFLADHTDTLIGEAVMMVSAGLTLEQVGEAIHPHPTTTELFGEMARRLLARIKRTKR